MLFFCLYHQMIFSAWALNSSQALEFQAVWLAVRVDGGASCHVGYRSCFYRKIPEKSLRQGAAPDRVIELEFTETEKIFDPEEVYRGVPNPTKL